MDAPEYQTHPHCLNNGLVCLFNYLLGANMVEKLTDDVCQVMHRSIFKLKGHSFYILLSFEIL